MTHEELDAMWSIATRKSIEENQPYTRYEFAKMVAAIEREEIAQFIEQTKLGSLPEQLALHYAQLLGSYATAIRARGEA